MNLKIFYGNKLLSAWIISSIYLSAINSIYVIRADDSENSECGIQFLEDSPSDSLFVRQYEYPWKAAIGQIEEKKLWSGNLVNKNTILTTLPVDVIDRGDIDVSITMKPEKLIIGLGIRNLSADAETGLREFNVKKVVIHPRWNINSASYDGDIVIITLTEDVTFSKYIRPICLPDESVASITTGQISSWAPYDKTKQYSEIPRKKEIQIVEWRKCFRDSELAKAAWEESFCAGAEGYSFCFGSDVSLLGIDPTFGSSGIGFYVQKNGKFYLRGMVSFYGSKIFDFIGTPDTALFTDLLKYGDFLEENGVFNLTPDLSNSNEDCGVPSAVVGLVSHGDSLRHGLLK